MAKATIELRDLLGTKNIVTGESFELFDFQYEFDDPIMRKRLEQVVLDEYMFAEIGQETPDRFKQRFMAHWVRSIRKINELWNLMLLEYDPLITNKYREWYEGERHNWGWDKNTGTDTLKKKGEGDVTRTDNLQEYNDGRDWGHVQDSGEETITEKGTETEDQTGTDTTEQRGSDSTASTGKDATTVMDNDRTIHDLGNIKKESRETVSDYPISAVGAPTGDLSTGYLAGASVGNYASGSRMNKSEDVPENTRTISGSTTTEYSPGITTTRTPLLDTTRKPNLKKVRTPDLVKVRTPTTRKENEQNIDHEKRNEGTQAYKTVNRFEDEQVKNLKDEHDKMVKDKWERNFEGMSGRTYQSLIKEQMDLIIDLESMIINAVKPCFFMVYSW